MPTGRFAPDLVGQVFGRLTVIRFGGRTEKGRFALWECGCSCGARVTVRASRLRRGESKSCGCLQRELASAKIINPKMTAYVQSIGKPVHMRMCRTCWRMFFGASQQQYCPRCKYRPRC